MKERTGGTLSGRESEATPFQERTYDAEPHSFARLIGIADQRFRGGIIVRRTGPSPGCERLVAQRDPQWRSYRRLFEIYRALLAKPAAPSATAQAPP
jgi:hypothetical protein